MSHLGATLQFCNEEIVDLIEDLKMKLESVQEAIDNDDKQKAILTAQIEEASRNLEIVNQSLNDKIALKNGLVQTINEAQTAYEKIVESSQTLITLVKKKSSILKEMTS